MENTIVNKLEVNDLILIIILIIFFYYLSI